jgi:hypothetical protein
VVSWSRRQTIDRVYGHGIRRLTILRGCWVIAIGFAFPRYLTEGVGVVCNVVHAVVHRKGRWEKRREGVEDRQTQGARLS